MIKLTKTTLTEATGFARQILQTLRQPMPQTITTAQFYWITGYMLTNASNQLKAIPTPFFTNVALCFDLSVVAGFSYQQMEIVRQAAVAMTPIGIPAIYLVNFAIRMCLIEQARILAATTFTSRQDIDNYIDLVQASFSQAEDVAADAADNANYMALVALRAAVVNDLSTRALPLPQIVVYTSPIRQPALTLAQRIYQDGSRGDQLVDENYIVNPLFCPTSIFALSE